MCEQFPKSIFKGKFHIKKILCYWSVVKLEGDREVVSLLDHNSCSELKEKLNYIEYIGKEKFKYAEYIGQSCS